MPEFLAICRMKNKPSEVQTKESILRWHLLAGVRAHTPGPDRIRRDPGLRREDHREEALEEDGQQPPDRPAAAARRREEARADRSSARDRVAEGAEAGFRLPHLRRGGAARGRGRPGVVLHDHPRPQGGARQGELLALRLGGHRSRHGSASGPALGHAWHRDRAEEREGEGDPTRGRGDRGAQGRAAPRGPLVFCDAAGRMWKKNECKHPLWRACKKAGLRQMGWHVLRHTFASHLVMRGAAMKAVQELLGHATIEMTMRYAHLSPDVPRHAVKLLDGLGRLGTEAGRQAGDKDRLVLS